MLKSIVITLIISLGLAIPGSAQFVLIPMDDSQTNHLKAYGVIYNHIAHDVEAWWLLNYRGGSFMAQESHDIVREARLRNVHVERVSNSQANRIIEEVERDDVNMAAVPLEETPRIAVYSPSHALPWDDAVTLALTYAEVDYDIIYNEEVLAGDLDDYDWLHLHHEDFTGQYGKFWFAYRNTPWYQRQVRDLEEMAERLGFDKVTEMKKAVVYEMRDYVGRGGFLFAMCSGTDTFDIALAALDVDIAPRQFDGDPPDPDANERLDFSQTLAFENFRVTLDPDKYEHGNIDIDAQATMASIDRTMDYFTLFEFSAKWDPVPTMLTQNHVSSVRGFMGQTTAFRMDKIKSNVVIMGKNSGRDEAKYITGVYGEGTFTFYGGHDPEDYTHRVGDPPTDLDLHPNSPGYRLILNNILFPAAQEKKIKTERLGTNVQERDDLAMLMHFFGISE